MQDEIVKTDIHMCPICKVEGTFVVTFRGKSWVKYCNAKGCSYKEPIKTDTWSEEL